MKQVFLYQSFWYSRTWLFILYIPTSLCIFSVQFSLHSLQCWKGDFFFLNQAHLVGDHFLYSHCLNVWLRADVLKRNWMLLKLIGWRVKWSVPQALVLLHWSELEQNSRTWLIITSPIWAQIGQLTRHACVSGQFASCTRAVVAHFADFFMKTCDRCLVCFSDL